MRPRPVLIGTKPGLQELCYLYLAAMKNAVGSLPKDSCRPIRVGFPGVYRGQAFTLVAGSQHSPTSGIYPPRKLRGHQHVELDFKFVFGSDSGFSGWLDPEFGL